MYQSFPVNNFQVRGNNDSGAKQDRSFDSHGKLNQPACCGFLRKTFNQRTFDEWAKNFLHFTFAI